MSIFQKLLFVYNECVQMLSAFILTNLEVIYLFFFRFWNFSFKKERIAFYQTIKKSFKLALWKAKLYVKRRIEIKFSFALDNGCYACYSLWKLPNDQKKNSVFSKLKLYVKIMDVLLNGLSITAEKELQSLCCAMEKTMSLRCHFLAYVTV